jgi:hypothetical protein
MRCVLAVSAAFLLTALFGADRAAHANPALLAAKVAQAASRAAQLGRAASAAGKASKLGKLGRIGTRVMRRVMAGRNLGPGGLKPNALRLRLQRALKKRGVRNLQQMAAERNKNFRLLMKKRMSSLRTGVRNLAQKQIEKRVMKMNRLLRDRSSAMRRMQSMQRKSRAQSNRQDADRRRMMRSHASEMRRRSTETGMFASSVLRRTGAAH